MKSIGTPTLWVTFTIVVVVVLAIDLYIGSKSHKVMSKRTALAWTSLWVSLAAAFGAGVWIFAGPTPGMEFATAYIIEYSLSVDNLFVFLLIFSSFKVPREYQHRVLFWGIFGAVVMRAIFIFAGTALIQNFTWVIYLFGAFLIFTGAKLVLGGEDHEEVEVSERRIVKFARRILPVAGDYDGQKFFTVVNGVRTATPLLLVLVVIELSDLVFAVDSIPAVFGVSTDPFIVYTSNIFAILGLRSLFFLLAGALWGLRFLKPALGIVLTFVGIKMCLPFVHWALGKANVALEGLPEHVPTPISLTFVAGVLALGVAASFLFPGVRKDSAAEIKNDLRGAVDGPHAVTPGTPGASAMSGTDTGPDETR